MYILSDLQNSLFENLSKTITDFLDSWNIFIVKTKTINNNIFIEDIDIDSLIEPNKIFEISSTVNNINYEKYCCLYIFIQFYEDLKLIYCSYSKCIYLDRFSHKYNIFPL